MDPRDLDCRVMWAHSYEALPLYPGSLWSTVIPRPSLAQSTPSCNVIDTDEGGCITNALEEHAWALYQMALTQEVVNPSDARSLEPLTSPGDVCGTCLSSSSSKDSLRSAGVWAYTFIENPEHANVVVPNLCKVWKSNHNLEVLEWALK